MGFCGLNEKRMAGRLRGCLNRFDRPEQGGEVMRNGRAFLGAGIGLIAFVLVAVEARGQSTWTQRRPSVAPASRWGHAMAYDAVRQRVVLFGGYGIQGVLNDTWEWDGNVWSQSHPAVSPPPQMHHALAYDAARQRVVLFEASSLPGNHTWEWDGITWTQRIPVVNPPQRFGHAMAYDAGRQRVVLFGGAYGPGNDTWEWDGITWAQRSPAGAVGRLHHALVYDAAHQRVVLFGGRALPLCNDTWEWDGTSWFQRTPVLNPAAREWHSLAYDTVRQRVVLFGGDTGIPPWLNDTWEWDGNTWSAQATASRPLGRYGHAMVYDAARHHFVLFGGQGDILFNDTWAYAATLLRQSGAARPGAVVSLALDALGDAGLPYQLGTSLGNGPTPIDTRQIGLSPDALLGISVGGQWPTVFGGYRGVIDSKEQGSATIHIPSLPALIGVRLHTAFVTIDPQAPSGLKSISNTETLTITV
jgi:hypothetical protein